MFTESEKSEIQKIVSEAISGHNEDTLKAIHEELQQMNPENKITKEKIMAVKDRRERQRLIAAHLDLF